MKTKIYLDGFKVEDITPPNSYWELDQAIKASKKIQAILGEKKVASITPIPFDRPRIVLISTEL